jgi:hypothetical protein
VLKLDDALAECLADTLRFELEQDRPRGVVLRKVDGRVVRLDANRVRCGGEELM